MIETKDLAKTFRSNGTVVDAVKGINLTVGKGEIFSLLGPNGAGKTTTISMISGLMEPTRGDAFIGGFSITHQPLQAKRLLGVVPQEIALYPTLNARQNLEFFGRMYGLNGKDLTRRVNEMLDFVELSDRQYDRIETYSGGMKRRINIAAGLLHDPQVVYMDEPTVGIDPQSRRRILDTVKQLREQRGMTVLYTTHLMEEAQELSDRVGIIDHGEIIALGTPGDLIQQVGEQDRLIFKVGQAVVSNETLEHIRSSVDGVTQVIFDPPGGEGENKTNISGLLIVSAKRGRKALPFILHEAEEAGIEIESVEVREPDLEAVFLHLTGRELRD
ncbi:MAG: export ABC transporter ATP-binding protein [Chloroflexi bacterium RBG_13_50_21]|nr:MAG: export ABC transporter ATP-binding protein [Chloroflexi bacterium RBG_13_50_21]